MERNFKRISDGLKLPQESRERIRSQLASYQKQSEDIPMKKSTLKSRVPLIAVAVVMMMALTLTAAAAVVVHLFRNDIIVSSRDDIPMPSSENGAPSAVAIDGPGGNPPATLEETIKSNRFKSDDWVAGERINGGVVSEYHQWDSVEVLSSDPVLRSRRIGREDGAEKMEYTAENPANLLDTLTGRVTFDLEWVNEHYDYVPDANWSFVVSDAKVITSARTLTPFTQRRTAADMSISQSIISHKPTILSKRMSLMAATKPPIITRPLMAMNS